MWLWEYESCDRCGCCYRLVTNWADTKWIEVVGTESGCLCLDCFVALAQERGVILSPTAVELLWIFDPDQQSGGSFDLLYKNTYRVVNGKH